MRRLAGAAILSGACALSFGVARAQRGGGGDWTTAGNDAQRSGWVRADPKISREGMQKPGFSFVWKVKVGEARGLNSLTPAVHMDRYIGYRGFRTYAFVAGSSDKIVALDTDLGKIEWTKAVGTGSPIPGASLTCPGGLTAAPTRPVGVAIPMAGQGGGRGGGRGAARSGVGEPDAGAVTIQQAAEEAAARGAAQGGGGGGRGRGGAPGVPGAPGAPPAGRGGGGGGGRQAQLVYTLASDGMLHAGYVSNGEEPQPPVKFLAPNANATGLTVVDDVAYVTTSQGCGGVQDGVWALDMTAKQVASWKAGGGVAGSAGAAFGPDGTIYVTTGDGDLAALEPRTLKMKDGYKAGAAFTSSPVIFDYKDKVLIAAATKDVRIHIVDAAKLGGAAYKSAQFSTAADTNTGALATWQDAGGTRWLLAPTAGPVDSKFAANGSVTNGAIVAWKVTEQNGAPALEPGWASRDLTSPLPPMIINGVVFAVSSGEFRTNDAKMTAAQRAQKSSPAVLYALDGATGKDLWNSGRTITSFVHSGGLSGGGSQLYIGTWDGTLYAFGYGLEK